MTIEILNPLEIPNWDDLVLATGKGSFFHSAAWAKVLSESYGYKPLYFTSTDNGKLSGLIPIMEVKSYLTGTRGVSLPFTDFCQPIVSVRNQFREMVSQATKYGKEAGWKYFEWRGGETYCQNRTPSNVYYGHILDIGQNEDELLKSYRNSTMRNIRKAVKEGVHVRISNSMESVKAFYRLNCITKKRHGLPPQPFYFFNALFEHIISKSKGVVVIASYQKRDVAGAVFLHFGDRAYFKYGASDMVYHAHRPNNLVLGKAIEFYANNGFRFFDFGRTDPENEGLLQFKKGWGTKKITIKYYRYDLKKNEYLQENSRVNMFSKLFKKTPIPLLNLTGYLLYKHAG